MGREKRPVYYEAAKDGGIRPSYSKEPDKYEKPVSYGEHSDGAVVPTYAPASAPSGYYAAAQPQPAGYYSYPQPMVPPGHGMVPGMVPGMMPSMGGWYGGVASPASPLSPGNFAQYGVKQAGVKITASDDRPAAVMIVPHIASPRATTNLAARIQWDVRDKPGADTISGFGSGMPDLNQPATNPPTRSMYIVCEHIPWAISIRRYNAITCQDVLDHIYKALQEPIKREEYFAADKKKRDTIQKVMEREADSRDEVYNESGDTARPADPLRIDWLDRMTSFLGLFIDDRILEERCMWQIDDLKDAWVLDLQMNGEP